MKPLKVCKARASTLNEVYLETRVAVLKCTQHVIFALPQSVAQLLRFQLTPLSEQTSCLQSAADWDGSRAGEKGGLVISVQKGLQLVLQKDLVIEAPCQGNHLGFQSQDGI